MTNLFNPTFWLVELVIAAALLMSGYGFGQKTASSACAVAQAQAQQALQAKADETSERREKVAQSREVAREQIRVVYRTIKEKADENIKNNPEFNNCGLDADGLRLWNAANDGSLKTLRGESDSSVPSATTGPFGQSDGPVPESHRVDGAVQPVPGSTGEAGGMRTGVIHD